MTTVVSEELRDRVTDVSHAGSHYQRRWCSCGPVPGPHRLTAAGAGAMGRAAFVMTEEESGLCVVGSWTTAGNEHPVTDGKCPQRQKWDQGSEERQAQRGGERGERHSERHCPFLLPSSHHLPLGKSPKSHCQGAGKCGLKEKGGWGSSWKPRGNT